MSGTVRARRAGEGDETVVRDLRLRALADSPDDFDSTLERERSWMSSEWTAWIRRGATFVAEIDGEPVGLAAGDPHRDDDAVVFLAAMWVRPGSRGTGAADALVAAVVSWARARSADEVRLHVLLGNARSRRFYERNGFRATGEIVRGRDGRCEIEMSLSLRAAGAPDAPPPLQ